MATELKRSTKLAWRKWLLTEPGVEGMLILRERVPAVVKGQPHEMIYDGGYAQGYQKCLDNITELIAVEDRPAKDESND